MIVGFSKHGRGSGDGPVGYMTDGMVSAIGYMTENSRRGRLRNPAPAVLKGNAKLTQQLIDRVPHQWKYTSGVLSFAPGEKITPAMEPLALTKIDPPVLTRNDPPAGVEVFRFQEGCAEKLNPLPRLDGGEPFR